MPMIMRASVMVHFLAGLALPTPGTNMRVPQVTTFRVKFALGLYHSLGVTGHQKVGMRT